MNKKESIRTAVITTVICVVIMLLLVADFHDNGKIDNDKFFVVALFIFSGAGAGRALDALVDKYLGVKEDEKIKKEKDDAR